MAGKIILLTTLYTVWGSFILLVEHAREMKERRKRGLPSKKDLRS